MFWLCLFCCVKFVSWMFWYLDFCYGLFNGWNWIVWICFLLRVLLDLCLCCYRFVRFWCLFAGWVGWFSVWTSDFLGVNSDFERGLWVCVCEFLRNEPLGVGIRRKFVNLVILGGFVICDFWVFCWTLLGGVFG